MTKTVIAGALGECVHVAGVSNFLRLAEQPGWRTVFLGPAVPAETVIEAARREKPTLRLRSNGSNWPITQPALTCTKPSTTSQAIMASKRRPRSTTATFSRMSQ
jgi:hypothetical protein